MHFMLHFSQFCFCLFLKSSVLSFVFHFCPNQDDSLAEISLDAGHTTVCVCVCVLSLIHI